MSKRRRKNQKRNSNKCPEPLNTMIDLAGAAIMGAYVNHKVKQDFKNGCGEESAKAAATVFGISAMRKGSGGMLGLGGLIGLNSALDSIEKQQERQQISYIYDTTIYDTTPYISPIEATPVINHPVRPGLWREHCEDGSIYGLDPYDYDTADDYESALQKVKEEESDGIADESFVKTSNSIHNINDNGTRFKNNEKYRWRKYCEDGSEFGIYPEDYETADDYAEALEIAKNNL